MQFLLVFIFTLLCILFPDNNIQPRQEAILPRLTATREITEARGGQVLTGAISY